jgi:hypothetical protein
MQERQTFAKTAKMVEEAAYAKTHSHNFPSGPEGTPTFMRATLHAHSS